MKVLSMIKQAVITLVTSDASSYPQGQAKHNGKTTDYTRLSPYGLVSNPPKGSWVLLLSSMAQSAVKFGIASDMLGRIKGLKEGECGLYNTKTTSFALLKENGDIEADAKGDLIGSATGSADITAGIEINLTAPTINLNGDVNVSGDLTAVGTVEGSELTDGSVPYSTHVHGGVDPGSGSSGGPE